MKTLSFFHNSNQRGNVLFLILIAVALFAALSYAVTSSQRGGGKNTDAEKAKLDQAVIDSYMAAVNTGVMRLRMRGCSVIDYTPPAGWGSENHNCHLFHPDGAGVSYQDLGIDSCTLQGVDITALAIGEAGCGLVYAGTSGGHRIYTMPADQGAITWNNGSGNWIVTGANSSSDGKANTDLLVGLADIGAPYVAAGTCRALGPEWYLPSLDEVTLLYTNRVAIGGFDLSGTCYWTSTEEDMWNAKKMRFNGTTTYCGAKTLTNLVRCVRR